ncbi:MAG TPA: hypothetical protein VFJ30_10010 [Phycisphaerae bacterium]|nr:hypothetical protein [Phycisphaerae bacterium]
MKTVLAILLAATLASAEAPKKYVVVFDFECKDSPALGRQLADSVRLRLRRHEGYDVLDKLSTAEMTPAGGVGPETADAKVAGLLKDPFAAQVAVMGRLEKAGEGFRVQVRCVDISSGKPVAWTKVFSDTTERARGLIAEQITQAVRGSAEWKPPEYGDEDEPKSFGKALNLSGDFESEAGWQRPDNVSMRIVPDRRSGRGGNVLRLFTDLDREAWLKYQQDLRVGKADPSKPPEIGTVANKYATVAGLEGVHFRSQWIQAEPGKRYWLVADMKGKTAGIFFPKIFVKGFADFSALADGLSDVSLNEMGISPDALAKMPAGERTKLIAADAKAHPDRYRREVYRWYLACRNEENVWKHYAAPFPPRGGLPKIVQWLRIEVYAYWPPGEFLFDDVHLYADPRQKAPLPEVKARTPSYKPPSTQPSRAN